MDWPTFLLALFTVLAFEGALLFSAWWMAREQAGGADDTTQEDGEE